MGAGTLVQLHWSQKTQKKNSIRKGLLEAWEATDGRLKTE